jgi:predicted DNA-binding helix-hairpin-helix protein
MREHRLYQSDWLMRFYGFEMSELTSEADPSLSLTEDPKTTWAKRHLEFFPIDVNAAPREALLRVPGIGYRNVQRILSIRRYHKLQTQDLQKLHIRLKLALPYLVTADHLPQQTARTNRATQAATQLDLFATTG